jgi:hypothetical protein
MTGVGKGIPLLDRYVYQCPHQNGEPEFVTLWSNQAGDTKDNPFSSSWGSIEDKGQKQMVLVSFAHMDCFNLTFANMIGKYHQASHVNPKNGKVHGGYPLKHASEGGNPLNDTKELNFENFQGFTSGTCGYASKGRNWLMSGSCDPSGSPPCAAQNAPAELDRVRATTSLVDMEEPAQPYDHSPGKHLWSRRIRAEQAGRLAPLKSGD